MDLTNVCPQQNLVLVKQGEYGMDLSYDYSSWVEEFGPGSVGWTIQRSADPGAYPLAQCRTKRSALGRVCRTWQKLRTHGNHTLIWFTEMRRR